MEKQDKQVHTLEDDLYFVGLCVLPVGILSLVVLIKWLLPNLPEMNCFFWKCLGVYCPGCGGTRAVIALCEGDLLLSLWYHPLVLYIVGMYSCFMLSHTLAKIHVPFVKGMKFHEWIMYGALVVIVINFILKNVLKFCFGIVM